jgi:hypothetical protein
VFTGPPLSNRVGGTMAGAGGGSMRGAMGGTVRGILRPRTPAVGASAQAAAGLPIRIRPPAGARGRGSLAVLRQRRIG